jgi:two-component system, OmpR family, phosphate regulon sensor histidine kinase PhoR
MRIRIRKTSVNTSTFLKTWCVSSALVLTLFIAMPAGFLGDAVKSNSLANMVESRARGLADLIENKELWEAVRPLSVNPNAPSGDPGAVRAGMEAWLESNPRVVSAEFWRIGDTAPIRVVNPESVRQLEAESPDAAEQKRLRDFLAPAAVRKAPGGKNPQVNAFLIRTPFDRSLLDVLIPLESAGGTSHFSVKLLFLNPSAFLSERLDSGEVLTLRSNGNPFMVFSDGSTPVTEPGRRTESVECSVLFRVLPWQLHYSNRFGSSFRAIADYRLWLNCCAGILACLALSYALTGWIDRPFNRLMETAVEIGRGNFGLRVPPQKNRSMNRLAKLINYMAMEMDHLQKMNVSAIINEKNKTEIILRNIADGVLVLDAEGRIMLVNATAEQWLRVEEANVLQKPFKDCLRLRPLVSLLQEVFRDRPVASVELTLKQADSRQDLLILASATRVTNRDGRTIGTVTVLRDVTKEREADRIKTELVSMVAHELKSPLTSIYGFSELLIESESQDKKSLEYARVIQGEAIRLTDFVNKFLSLSRLESGKIAIKMDPFDLRPVIEKTIDLFKAQADPKNILIVLQAPDPIPLVVGDQELLDQVMVNLVSNAIKYSPRHSKIGIEVSTAPKEVVVNIIDNGYGIPKESLPKIFDKFFRVSEPGGEEEPEGSGLGLALVKEIIEKHGGSVKVKSKLGVGSVFTFSLLKAGMSMNPEAGE